MVASITCSNRQEIVRGPTPPRTGVMAARSVREWISSLISPLKTPSSLAVPASTTTAPGLIISLVIRPGWPVAVMMISKSFSLARSEPR